MPGLSARDRRIKRMFDVAVASIGLLCTGWIILLAYIAAALDTGENGFFTQRRVGEQGKLFRVIKIRTMRRVSGVDTSVTRADDPRITRLGALLRRAKIDELPQLINVLLGQMSLVGPRPDVPGFADRLSGADRIILSVKPGITGPATLTFRREEEILAQQPDPEAYNREVIYPAKVRINREYIESYHFRRDLVYLWHTLAGHAPTDIADMTDRETDVERK